MTLPGPWVGLVLALATYRILRLLMADEITEPLRQRFIYPDAPYTDPPFIVQLWACPWCLGAYVSGLVFAAYEFWPHTTPILAVPFALSAAAAMLGLSFDS